MQLLRSFPGLIIWVLFGITLSSAKEVHFQFKALDVSSHNKAGDACIAIFTVNAPCASIGDFVMDTDLPLDTVGSEDLLQGSHLSSLIGLQDSLKEQCGSKASFKLYSDDSIWKPVHAMEEAIHNVARSYIGNGNRSEEYCNMWFQMPDRRVTFCDECYKIILWHNIPSSLSEDTSASSSCGIEQCTNPNQPLLILSPTCSPIHTIKAGDRFLSLNDYIRAEDAPFVPIANGTRTDCFQYFWWNEKKVGSPAECLEVAGWYELDPEQFFLWNPSLDKNVTVEGTPTYDFPCTISPYVSYCMLLESPTPTLKKPFAPPSPRAEGEIANCARWFMAYFPCSTQLRNSRMSMELMYRYNPSLKEDCSGYTLGTYYCHETLEDYHGYGLGREDKSKSTSPQSTAVDTTSDIAQPTEII